MRARECIVFYVASPSRLFSATRAAGEMTRAASARAGWKGRERERAKRRDFFVFLWTRIGNLKSRKRAFFFQEEEEGSVGSFRTLLRGEGDILIALTSFAFSHSLFPKK